MYLFFRHAVLLVAGVHLAVVELFSVVDLIRSAHDVTINTVDEQRGAHDKMNEIDMEEVIPYPLSLIHI